MLDKAIGLVFLITILISIAMFFPIGIIVSIAADVLTAFKRRYTVNFVQNFKNGVRYIFD